MQRINLKSIKWESIRSIFGAIADEEKITRADISARTGLSLMTVSKVSDALLENKIISQAKETKVSAGRRAGLLSLNSAWYSAVMDLTEKDFGFSLINIKSDVLETHKYIYNDDFQFEENLSLFLQQMKQRLALQKNPDLCVGVGVLLPGVYKAESDHVLSDLMPQLNTVPIAQMLKNTLPDLPITIDSAVHAAACAVATSLPTEKQSAAWYLYIGERNISGAFCENGCIRAGAHGMAGTFGKTEVFRGRTLQNAIRIENPLAENASELARSIYNILMITDPDCVILECDLYKNGDAFIDLVRETLADTYSVPKETIVSINEGKNKCRHSHRGIMLKLRQMWLSRLILSE